MTNFEWLKSLDENQMRDFLYNIKSDIDDKFTKKFCDKCSNIVRYDLGHLHMIAYCEVEGKVCPHFDADRVAWWLQEEHEEEKYIVL